MISAVPLLSKRLAERIKERSADHHASFVVAIDGRSGSGKSTIASFLKAELDAIVIPGDDFFAGGVQLRNDPPQQLAADCMDWRSLGTVLDQLKRQGTAQYRPFDWEKFDGSKSDRPISVESRPVIVVEGVYSARPELRDLIDLAVLVDIDEDLRLQRLLEREGEISGWEQQWHLGENWYFTNVALRESFDFVVDNSI